MVTRQLQVERRTGKVRLSKTDFLPTVPRNQPLLAKLQHIHIVPCTDMNVPLLGYLTLKNITTLKSKLEVTHSANLCTICTNQGGGGYFFAADNTALTVFTSFYAASPETQLHRERWRVAVVQDR